ncbi:4'-phosphopantetheinyl transferase family protein [Streptomyces sp. NPDC055400]
MHSTTTVVVARPLPGLAGVLRLGGDAAAEDLHEEERDLLTRIPERRRRDFVLGRRAAAHALAQVGREGAVVREGAAPRFPDGVHGSISHCLGRAAASVVTIRQDMLALGVDVERVGRLSPSAAPLICTEREQSRLGNLGSPLLTTVFSAKESIYKALGRLAIRRTPLVFHGVEVTLCGSRIQIADTGGLLLPNEAIEGEFWRVGEYVWTMVWVWSRRT